MPKENWTCQLIDFTWKAKNWASLTATVAVLILTFLCKGVRSEKVEGFTLTVPDSVSVQRGLCVHIPCTFTYRGQPQIPTKKLYAYWFKDKEQTKHYLYNQGYNQAYIPGLLVATNDERQYIDSSASERFRLTGDPAHGDCSFSINNAASADQELYYLRIDGGGGLKVSYRFGYTRPRVVVTALTEKPEIRKSSELILGEPVTISCQAPGSCSGTPPQISWTPYNIDTISKLWKHPHSNGSWTYVSNVTITPSKDNEGEVLTCSVTYWAATEWAKTANSIRVAIAHPPATVHITVNVTSNGRLGSSERDPDSVVALEGNTVTLLCQADSIPDPLLSWTKGNKTLNDPKQAKEHILPLARIRAADAGLYRCQAENLLGSAAKAVRVTVQYPPRTLQLSVSQTHEWDPVRPQDPPRAVDNGSQLTAREGNALRLFCKADSHPPVEVSWVKGSRIVKQWSPSPDNWLELTGLTVEEKGEYACHARNSLGSTQGTFQLDIAYAPTLFKKTNSTCWREDNDFLCTCALHSWPATQIQWQVDGETLSGNSSRGPLNVTSWLQGKRATSNLRLSGSLDDEHSVTCIGNNSVGVYTMQFLLSPFKTGSHAAMFLSGFCGALLAAGLCIMGFFLIRFYKRRKASPKAGAADAMGAVNEEPQSAKNPSLIYGNIFPAKPRTPQVGQPKAAREMNSEPSHTSRAPRLGADEPGELHYATLEFKSNSKGPPAPSEDSVEYSEIRVN